MSSTLPAVFTRTGRRRSPEFKFVPQGKSVARAWAIELDEECLYRWGIALYDELHPGTRATKSPDEIRKFIHDWRLMTAERMAYLTYCKFPDLPRLERNVLVIQHFAGMKWLFVLKDDSSREAFGALVTPEHVESVREFLGLESVGLGRGGGAMWFDVARRINGYCD